MADPWSLAVTLTGDSPVSMADLWIWCQSMVTHQWSSHPGGRPLQKVLECCEVSLLYSGSPPALTCPLHSSVFGRIQCRSPLDEILKRKWNNETAWLLSYSLLVAAHSTIPGLDCEIKVETETVSVTFKPLTDLVWLGYIIVYTYLTVYIYFYYDRCVCVFMHATFCAKSVCAHVTDNNLCFQNMCTCSDNWHTWCTCTYWCSDVLQPIAPQKVVLDMIHSTW